MTKDVDGKKDDVELDCIEDEKEPLDSVNRLTTLKIFIAMFLVETLINFDSGSVPASLVDIKRTLNLTYLGEGILGSVVYIGLAGSSSFAGYIFHHYNCKSVLVFTTVLNGVSCALFALSPNALSLILCRFVLGISQAFPVIYAPIWVDQFAPNRHKTLWMSLMYICSPLGIMLGFASGIVFSDENASPDRWWARWRIPLIMQGVLLVTMGLLMMLVPRRFIDSRLNVEPDTIAAEGTEAWQKDRHHHRRSSCEDRLESLSVFARSGSGPSPWRVLLANRLFRWTVLNLSVLFFVVTGIQYWVKAYLEEVIGSDGSVVGIAFVFVSATAPTGGVIFGGWLIDRLGGYGGPIQILKTLRINASLGACAVACCLAILFLDSLAPIMTLIWLLLFSGGATVPSLTGIIVSSVKPSLRSFASSLSQLSFNILGFALSTLIPGVVMEFTGSREWGFNTVMLWSLWGVIVTMFGIWAAMDNVKLMRRFVDANLSQPDETGNTVTRVEVRSAQTQEEESDDFEKELARFPVAPMLGEMMIPVQFGVDNDIVVTERIVK